MGRKIDITKCIGCGKCVDDCINQYLILKKHNDGREYADFKERGHCLNCGHCNAICPVSAIEGGELEEFKYSDDELLVLMGRKRTVRKFDKSSEIKENELERIVFAGETAPTDRNRKSARIYLIKESLPTVYNEVLDFLVAEVKKNGTIDPLYVPTMKLDANREEILWGAEYLVVFVGKNENLTDAIISAERMQLEAEKLGIGTAYRGDIKKAFNNVESLKKRVEMKRSEEVLIAFAMGHTQLKYIKTAVKKNRKIIYI